MTVLTAWRGMTRMERMLAVRAAIVMTATSLVIGVGLSLRLRQNRIEIATEWSSLLNSNAHGVVRRIETWLQERLAVTAFAASVVDEGDVRRHRLTSLTHARAALGASSVWILASDGRVLAHDGVTTSESIDATVLGMPPRPGVYLSRLGPSGLYIQTVVVFPGAPWFFVRCDTLDDALRRLLPYRIGDIASHTPLVIFPSGDSLLALGNLAATPGGKEPIVVQMTSRTRAPSIWKQALSGHDTAGEWVDSTARPRFVGIASSEQHFGAAMAVDAGEAFDTLRERAASVVMVAGAIWIVIAAGVVYWWRGTLVERRSRAAREEARALEVRLARAEVEALRVQLQPHFLFNTMNTVVGLIDDDPDAARAVVEDLSDLLRMALKTEGTEKVTVEREMDVLALYVDIQRHRFGDRLSFTTHVDDWLYAALVPSFLIQPLVENAVRHGVAPKAGNGCVSISVTGVDGEVTIEVADDGLGMPERIREGIGLTNTRARLQALYGSRHALEIGRRPGGGTIVRVKLPWQQTMESRDVLLCHSDR